MNDSFTEEMIPVRFTFQADRAHEFLDDGRLVTQMEFETVDEIIEITANSAMPLLTPMRSSMVR